MKGRDSLTTCSADVLIAFRKANPEAALDFIKTLNFSQRILLTAQLFEKLPANDKIDFALNVAERFLPKPAPERIKRIQDNPEFQVIVKKIMELFSSTNTESKASNSELSELLKTLELSRASIQKILKPH